MKNIKRHIVFFSSLFPLAVLSQQNPEPIISNNGLLYIGPEKEITLLEDFDNKESGQAIVDGSVYFLKNFNNDNLFYYSNGRTTSKITFTDQLKTQEVQRITGNKPTDFYDVIFEADNLNDDYAFSLQNDINVHGTASFNNGRIVTLENQPGSMVFHLGAKSQNASNSSYGNTVMEKIGDEDFMFPIGANGYLGYAKISAPPNKKDIYGAFYFNNNESFFTSRTTKEPDIDIIYDKEYWLITRGRESDKEQGVYLTLSLSQGVPLDELQADSGTDLHVIYWNEQLETWQDRGGILDLANKEITTGAPITEMGFFTVASMKTTEPLPNDIIIYNLVSANGDDKNEYFFIENINRFPENKVQIYNRWGQLVFSTTNYDSDGNVFNGYAQGRGVIFNRGDKLPSGTYFYLVQYTIDNENGKRTQKKSGYLHLDTN